MNIPTIKRGYGLFAFLFIVLYILSFANTLKAATFCVTDETELQAALDAAEINGQNDVIQIQQGTYYGSFIYASTEAFGVTIEGGYTSGCASRVIDPTNTVLDAQNNGTVLVLTTPYVAADFVVDGLKLQNGKLTGGDGGGLLLKSGGNNTVINNNFSNNSSKHGGGAYIHGDNDTTVENNNFYSNTANWGGGIRIKKGKLVSLYSNLISKNQGNSSDGGGIYASDIGILTIKDNIITQNYSWDDGGGLVIIDTSTANIINNEITFNFSLRDGSAVGIYDATIFFNNNFISNNKSFYRDTLHFHDSKLFLINNIIVRNSAEQIGKEAIYLDCTDGYSSYLVNNTISNNTSFQRGGIHLIHYNDACVTNIYNNIIFNNSGSEVDDLYINNDPDGDYFPNGTIELFNNDFDQSSQV